MASIISSSNTPFAEFIKAINATDWVRQGHEHFRKDDKCPYGQQRLPKDFDKQIAACFDGQYQKDIEELRKFQAAYERYMRGIVDALKSNLNDAFPKLDTSEYKQAITRLEEIIELNLVRIAEKVKEPSAAATLESVEVLCAELNAMIVAFNKRIHENNAILADKSKKKTECTAKVWAFLASFLDKEITEYRKRDNEYDAAVKELADTIAVETNAHRAIERRIGELNSKIVSIEPAVTGINNLIRSSGFQGFELRTCEDRGQNAYKVVRIRDGVENDVDEDNLSEGEYNFIAFLYFYYRIQGSHQNDTSGKPKIVVIDDPVSSMDSSVLFIVSALVRELVEICCNNVKLTEYSRNSPNYIKQLFVLTHNMYFHSEITNGQVERYDGVSFFMVNKIDGRSTVTLCDEAVGAGTKANVNPVKSAYVALWSEYKDLLKERKDDSISYRATLLNNSNQILEHYFIQLCGYSRDAVRKAIKDKRSGTPDGDAQRPKYLLALSMLDSITSDSRHAPDSAYFSGGAVDAKQYREAFKLIFDAMKHEQHYEKMMT